MSKVRRTGPHTLRYDFSLYADRTGGDYPLAYHLHPDTAAPGSKRSHVHVRARPGWLGQDLHKLHLPTGRVSPETFVRGLVHELGAEAKRPDWERRLDRLETRFKTWTTW